MKVKVSFLPIQEIKNIICVEYRRLRMSKFLRDKKLQFAINRHSKLEYHRLCLWGAPRFCFFVFQNSKKMWRKTLAKIKPTYLDCLEMHCSGFVLTVYANSFLLNCSYVTQKECGPVLSFLHGTITGWQIYPHAKRIFRGFRYSHSTVLYALWSLKHSDEKELRTRTGGLQGIRKKGFEKR